MNILGLAAPFGHDASAALIINGKIVAAAEEERFTRRKHADGQLPVNAVNFCLRTAGLHPSQIDSVAFPWSIQPLLDKRWEHLLRAIGSKPSGALKKFFRPHKYFRSQKNFVNQTLKECGFDVTAIKIEWVEHQLAHAASSLYLSGMKEAAVMSIDAGGEITCTMLGETVNGTIKKIKEVINTDSLGLFYATMTDYLGFDRGDGEYKVMGMAPYGDATRINFDHIIWWDREHQSYRVNDNYVWVRRDQRQRMDKVYSKLMVSEFGPEREGDGLAEPHIHIAAAVQKKLEEMTLNLVDTHFKDVLKRHGNLCFAGGCALNVAMNRLLVDLPYVKRLWIQPAANDAGTSLGAAVYVAHQRGEKIEPMTHAYWGPEYTDQDIEKELKQSSYVYEKKEDIGQTVAELLHQGNIVAWFQGRMEWGPRALGNRSILGNPTVKGTADKINEIIKFRENWRPFCPSILEEYAPDILDSDHPAPFMTIAFKANPQWSLKIPEVVHVDGTCRPQVVSKETNPKFHKLISLFHKKSGVPVVINTSLNRRGEPMVCSPRDALVMLEGSGLQYLALGNFLVRKNK